MIKKIIRNVVRATLRARKQESLNDTLARHIVKLKKRFGNSTKIDNEQLKRALLELDIRQGDSLMVHAAWREFYNYNGSPEEVISILREVLGAEGNIFMPSYGSSITFFDVDDTLYNQVEPFSRAFQKNFSSINSIDIEKLFLKSRNGRKL